MADPTLEELQQQIDELRSLITTEYEPPSGAEYSYPVVNQPMNDEMWQNVTLAMGNGVLDMGDGSYWLRGRDNVSDTAIIDPGRSGKAHAILRGFYHSLTASKTINLPPVTATTVYYVVLCYDPVGHNEDGGPITLRVVTSLNRTQGKHYLVLWTVTRKPNQVLTAATVQRFRPRASPVMYVWSEDQKPDVNSVLWGSMLIVGQTNNIYRSESRVGDDDQTDGAEWKLLNGTDVPFTSPGDTDSYEYAGHGYRRGARLTRDGYIELRGHISRVGGGNFTTGSHGYQMYDLNGWPKGNNQQFVTVSTGYDPPALVKLEYGSDQTLRAYPINRDCSWISLDGVRIYVGGN